jgi:hypothetical protein
VRVVLEALHELLDVLVQHRMEGDLAVPRLLLRSGRQLAEQDQVGGFEEVAFLGQLLDRVAPVEQDPLVAVDIGNRAATVRRIHECRVVRHQTEIVAPGFDLTEVHRADRAVLDRQLVLLPRAVVGDRQRVGHGSVTSEV